METGYIISFFIETGSIIGLFYGDRVFYLPFLWRQGLLLGFFMGSGSLFGLFNGYRVYYWFFNGI
jgi:hypothetical protein